MRKKIVLFFFVMVLLFSKQIFAAYHWIQNDVWVEGDSFFQISSFQYCTTGFGDRVCTVLDIPEDCVIDKIGVLFYGTEANSEFHVLLFEGDGVLPDPGTKIDCPCGVNPPYVIPSSGFTVLDLMDPAIQWQVERSAGDKLVVCLMYMGSGGQDVNLDICTDADPDGITPETNLVLTCDPYPSEWEFGETYGLTHNLVIRAGWEVPDPTETPTNVPTSTPTVMPTSTPVPPTWTPAPTVTMTPTITNTPTDTPTQIQTATYTPMQTFTPTPTVTATITATPSPFVTPTPGSPTWTPTPFPTSIPTETCTPQPTMTISPTFSPTPTPTPTYEPYRLPFLDDFEDILPWETQQIYGECLWHRETNRYYSEFHSWSYNKGDPIFNYDTGIRNSCSLVSPMISLEGAIHPVFSYWDWIEVEDREGFDICYTEISTDFGVSWSLLFQTFEPTRSWRFRGPFDLTPFTGNVILIRFRFDTVDSQFNNFEGWYIDDVSVREAPATTPTPTPYSGTPGVDLKLNEDVFYQGMRFLLELDYLNPTLSDLAIDAYIILDVYGSYWYWPSWEQSLDFDFRVIPKQAVTSEVILDFTWPAYEGSFSDIVIWAGALYTGTSDIFGQYDFVSFGANL